MYDSLLSPYVLSTNLKRVARHGTPYKTNAHEEEEQLAVNICVLASTFTAVTAADIYDAALTNINLLPARRRSMYGILQNYFLLFKENKCEYTFIASMPQIVHLHILHLLMYSSAFKLLMILHLSKTLVTYLSMSGPVHASC